jgi:hypothetical protein
MKALVITKVGSIGTNDIAHSVWVDGVVTLSMWSNNDCLILALLVLVGVDGFVMLLLPQVHGCPCVHFGCTHPIDGFEVYPSTCWV